MSDLRNDFLGAVETHSVEELRAVLDAGLDPRSPLDGKPLTTWLTEMYSRSDAFADCLRLLLDRGATLDDSALAPVLLNDVDGLRRALAADASLLTHRTTLRSAFTPLDDATLLHVAAEFGHVEVARMLVEAGADVNARAGLDADGLGGQTPLFHTVNSNANRSLPVMELLLDAGARVDVTVAGLVWGRGYDWETMFFDLTPISYAQLGCLPQMHRQEVDVTANVKRLLAAAGRPVPQLANVPNRYLQM
jgi:ankyrin repeat protein